jgi:23S rRNA pseudouridine955/2504/2580 synthase
MTHSKANPAPAARLLTVDEASEGQRLDNFLLRELKGVPQSRIYRMVRKGEVRVNKGRCKPDTRLQEGDVVRLPPVRTATREQPRSAGDLSWLEARILYEDEDLLAVDKPSGMAVHGGSGIRLGLIEAMRQLRPGVPALELVHRLDRDTSGVLLLAKRRSVLRQLHSDLREGKMRKRYLALVRGAWHGKARRVEAALEKNRMHGGERVVTVSDAGKDSVSRFVPQRNFAFGAALVAVELLTGRTHQARVHAAHIGHPIAGDDKYGDREFNRAMRDFGLQRLFLHAERLEFTHPREACKIVLEAPLPLDLQEVLESLEHAPNV